MMPGGDLFVHVDVLVDDLLARGVVPIPSHPGPAPVCSDAEVFTIALVRHLLGRPSEATFLAEVRRDWHHSFPHLPAQGEFRPGPWGTPHPGCAGSGGVRVPAPAPGWPAPCGRRAAGGHHCPVRPRTHPAALSGVGTGRLEGADELRAGSGRDCAHGEWFYGLRLARRTDLGTHPVRAWGIVSAAVDEGQIVNCLPIQPGAVPSTYCF